MSTTSGSILAPVTVSLQDLQKGAVPLSSLHEAFGPASLGIIVVKGLPPGYLELRRKVLSYSSYLASLPKDLLDELENTDAKYLTGWSLGKESLKPGVPDTLKGSYYINCAFYTDASLNGAPSEVPGQDKDYNDFSEYTAPNTWPSQQVLPGFRAATQELCNLIIDTAVLVAQACDAFAQANVEGYKKGYLQHMVKSSMTTKARLLHYFPAPPTGSVDTDEDVIGTEKENVENEDDWCATHIDHGCLTGLTSAMYIDEHALDFTRVLSTNIPDTDLPPLSELSSPPDPKTGLYIQSREGVVTKVSIPRDCLAFQTGEALERITKGKFKAVPHFVRGVEGGTAGGKIARNTLAVFTQPNLWEIVDEERNLDFAGFAREVAERFG